MKHFIRNANNHLIDSTIYIFAIIRSKSILVAFNCTLLLPPASFFAAGSGTAGRNPYAARDVICQDSCAQCG